MVPSSPHSLKDFNVSMNASQASPSEKSAAAVNEVEMIEHKSDQFN